MTQTQRPTIYSSSQDDDNAPIQVVSLDYDGCYGVSVRGNRSPLKVNEALLAHFPKGLMTLLVGSNRQSDSIDHLNACTNHSGSCFKAMEVLAKSLGERCTLDGYLLADTDEEKPDGYSFALSVMDTGKYRNPTHPEYKFDETKIRLLYAQMHRAASQNPNKKIVFNFYDDRADILEGLLNYFKKNPHMKPGNVQLNLNLWKTGQTGSPNMIGEPLPFNSLESSPIDFNYDENVRALGEHQTSPDRLTGADLKWFESFAAKKYPGLSKPEQKVFKESKKEPEYKFISPPTAKSQHVPLRAISYNSHPDSDQFYIPEPTYFYQRNPLQYLRGFNPLRPLEIKAEAKAALNFLDINEDVLKIFEEKPNVILSKRERKQRLKDTISAVLNSFESSNTLESLNDKLTALTHRATLCAIDGRDDDGKCYLDFTDNGDVYELKDDKYETVKWLPLGQDIPLDDKNNEFNDRTTIYLAQVNGLIKIYWHETEDSHYRRYSTTLTAQQTAEFLKSHKYNYNQFQEGRSVSTSATSIVNEIVEWCDLKHEFAIANFLRKKTVEVLDLQAQHQSKVGVTGKSYRECKLSHMLQLNSQHRAFREVKNINTKPEKPLLPLFPAESRTDQWPLYICTLIAALHDFERTIDPKNRPILREMESLLLTLVRQKGVTEYQKMDLNLYNLKGLASKFDTMKAVVLRDEKDEKHTPDTQAEKDAENTLNTLKSELRSLYSNLFKGWEKVLFLEDEFSSRSLLSKDYQNKELYELRCSSKIVEFKGQPPLQHRKGLLHDEFYKKEAKLLLASLNAQSDNSKLTPTPAYIVPPAAAAEKTPMTLRSILASSPKLYKPILQPGSIEELEVYPFPVLDEPMGAMLTSILDDPLDKNDEKNKERLKVPGYLLDIITKRLAVLALDMDILPEEGVTAADIIIAKIELARAESTPDKKPLANDEKTESKLPIVVKTETVSSVSSSSTLITSSQSSPLSSAPLTRPTTMATLNERLVRTMGPITRLPTNLGLGVQKIINEINKGEYFQTKKTSVMKISFDLAARPLHLDSRVKDGIIQFESLLRKLWESECKSTISSEESELKSCLTGMQNLLEELRAIAPQPAQPMSASPVVKNSSSASAPFHTILYRTMIAPNAAPRQVWCFDFDQTMVVPHLFQRELGLQGRDHRTEQERLALFRNPVWLKKFMEERRAAGDIIIITTFNSNKENVSAYLEALLGRDWQKTIYNISSAYHSFNPNKNLTITAGLKEIGVDLAKLPPANITLVDDDIGNCNAAQKAGYHAIHAKVGDDSYMKQLDARAAAIHATPQISSRETKSELGLKTKSISSPSSSSSSSTSSTFRSFIGKIISTTRNLFSPQAVKLRERLTREHGYPVASEGETLRRLIERTLEIKNLEQYLQGSLNTTSTPTDWYSDDNVRHAIETLLYAEEGFEFFLLPPEAEYKALSEHSLANRNCSVLTQRGDKFILYRNEDGRCMEIELNSTLCLNAIKNAAGTPPRIRCNLLDNSDLYRYLISSSRGHDLYRGYDVDRCTTVPTLESSRLFNSAVDSLSRRTICHIIYDSFNYVSASRFLPGPLSPEESRFRNLQSAIQAEILLHDLSHDREVLAPPAPPLINNEAPKPIPISLFSSSSSSSSSKVPTPGTVERSENKVEHVSDKTTLRELINEFVGSFENLKKYFDMDDDEENLSLDGIAKQFPNLFDQPINSNTWNVNKDGFKAFEGLLSECESLKSTARITPFEQAIKDNMLMLLSKITMTRVKLDLNPSKSEVNSASGVNLPTVNISSSPSPRPC